MSLTIHEEAKKILIGDPVRLNQILINLISNALKFTKNGAVSITADLKKVDGNIYFIEFKVKDNGIGIDERYQDKVFEMYYRATERSQGSGLGLFIVKEIIHKLGGEISIQSIRGKGTEFFIELPVIIS